MNKNIPIDSCGNEVFEGDIVVTHQRGYHHFCYAIVTKASEKRLNIVLCGEHTDVALAGIDDYPTSKYFLELPKSFRSPMNVAKVCDPTKISDEAKAQIERGKRFIEKHF